MKLQYLIIHCTDTPDGRQVSSGDIKKWHLEERSWSVVGYSDMIHLDGQIENLVEFNHNNDVDPWEITNGARGFNSLARHVVYVGGRGGDTRTSKQIEALEAYIKVMVFRHPSIMVAGHNAFSSKNCPSFDVAEFCKIIGIPKENIYEADKA